MYELLTTPRGPNPVQIFKAVQGPTIAKWKIHKSWRKREKEVFQDFRRFPWRGERQAQTDPLRTDLLAATLDREMAAVPASVRQHIPSSGNYPIVTDLDPGPGPNPFLQAPETPEEFLQRRSTAPPPNPADYTDGPHSGGNAFNEYVKDMFKKGGWEETKSLMRSIFGNDIVDTEGKDLTSETERRIRVPTMRGVATNGIGNLGPTGANPSPPSMGGSIGLAPSSSASSGRKRQREEDSAAYAAPHLPPGRRRRGSGAGIAVAQVVR